MRCCATCRGHRSLHWHRSRFPANGAAPRGGRRLKAEALGLAGRDGFAGDAVNPSVEAWPRLARVRCPAHTARPGLSLLPNPPEACLGPMPRTPPQTHPARPRTVSVCVRHGKSKKIKVKSGSLRSHPRVAWMCVDQGRRLPKQWCAGICQRSGGVGLRGIRGMDAAAKPTGTYLRRPRHPTPPRQASVHRPPLLLLLRLWPLSLRVPGRRPGQQTPTGRRAGCRPAGTPTCG